MTKQEAIRPEDISGRIVKEAYYKPEYVALWKKLDADPTVEEVLRNFPVRQPVLWL